ncbi:MAG: GerMN domain-containing protein, partial [Armatimonadota bacterium]|nr:GerMN domain-containing protein [Armatimonadota bacterium]
AIVIALTISPSDVAHAARTRRVKLFFVALNDNGKSGRGIGCGDSIIPVRHGVSPTSTPLTSALKSLLAIRYYGSSRLYNVLSYSRLTVRSVGMSRGTATVRLAGQLVLGGVCDNPRIEAQFKETIHQFPAVRRSRIFINGVRLEDVLSGR